METWNGNYVPAGGDPWDLINDMRKHAVQNNRLIPVFSKAERDDLATNAPGGTVPEGTVVLRLDQSSKGPVFDIYAGSGWIAGDTGWQDLTGRLRNGWVASSGTVAPAIKIRNGEAQMRGQIGHSTATGVSEAFTVPEGFAPTSSGGTLYFPLGARTPVQMSGLISVDGVLSIYQESASGALRPLNAIRYGLT